MPINFHLVGREVHDNVCRKCTTHPRAIKFALRLHPLNLAQLADTNSQLLSVITVTSQLAKTITVDGTWSCITYLFFLSITTHGKSPESSRSRKVVAYETVLICSISSPSIRMSNQPKTKKNKVLVVHVKPSQMSEI
jgi:hypothetical protein